MDRSDDMLRSSIQTLLQLLESSQQQQGLYPGMKDYFISLHRNRFEEVARTIQKGVSRECRVQIFFPR